jgi:putative RecB family exonuclease
MRISYTRFSTYQTCPQQYKLQYVDRIPVPTAPELLLGSAVHEALRFMYDPKHLSTPSVEEVAQAFITAWQEREAEVAEDRRQLYFEQGVDMLRRHYQRHVPREEGRVTAATERFFDVPLEGDHILNGRIDRIDVLPGRRLEIIDYKTGRTMPTQPMAEKDRQLAIYRMAADRLYPGQQVATTFLYLRHDFEMRVTQSEEFLAETRAMMAEVIARIQLGDYDPDPGPHCDWCAYRNYCPLFRAPVVPDDLHQVDIGAMLREYGELDAQAKASSGRLRELKEQINAYLDACQTERVEGEGYVAERRASKRITAWNTDQLRSVLEPLGLWEAITDVSSTSVKGLLSSDRLSREQKRAIESAAQYSETKALRVKPLAAGEEAEENEA